MVYYWINITRYTCCRRVVSSNYVPFFFAAAVSLFLLYREVVDWFYLDTGREDVEFNGSGVV